jgi:hypothetical protein
MHDVGLAARMSDGDIHQVLLPIECQLEVRARLISTATEMGRLLDGYATSMDGRHI